MSLVTITLRWILVPVVIAAIIAACIALASWAVTVADQRCTSMVAGTCVESWHSDAVEWAFYIAVFLTALAIPLLSAWIAPAANKPTALAAGLLASAPLSTGYLMTNWNDLLLPSLLAIGAAIIAIFLVWQQRATNTPTETPSA